jgi:hypothetical protein
MRSTMTTAEKQARKLLVSVSKSLQTMGSKVGQAATAASKRKYMVAGLAALVVAGAAAQQLSKSLGSTPARRQAARKATRTRSKRARGRRSTRRAAA